MRWNGHATRMGLTRNCEGLAWEKYKAFNLKVDRIWYLLRFTTCYITPVCALNFRKDLWGDLVIAV